MRSILGGEEGKDPFLCPLLSDEVLYNFILPSFESVFMGRSVHRSVSGIASLLSST